VENAYDRVISGVSLARIDYKISELDSSYVQKEKSLGCIEDLDVARAATQLANTEIKFNHLPKFLPKPMNYSPSETMLRNYFKRLRLQLNLEKHHDKV